MPTRRLALAAILVAAPAALRAQSVASDSLFARPRWGAEAAVGGGATAAIMRLHPSGTAWLLSLTATTQRATQRATNPFTGQTIDNETGMALVALDFGFRHYRSAGPLRPYAGAGVTGRYGWLGGPNHTWGAGIYGEIGAAYFVVPHVSVGVSQNLDLDYARTWSGNPETNRVTQWGATLPYPSVRLAVFF